MKKLLIMTLLLGAINAHAVLAGGGGGCEPGLDCAVAITSLPTFIVGDKNIDQSSEEFKALAINEAQRTIDGRKTLIFGNDILKAQEYLNTIQNSSQ